MSSDRNQRERRDTADEASAAGAMTRVAGAWVARLDRGLSRGEQRELAAWRAADPRHEAELARLQRTWKVLGTLDTAPELAAMADRVEARARARRTFRSVARWGAWAGAAAAIALSIAGWQWRGDGAAGGARLPQENYRVLASTLQRMVLPDGSVAELNGESRIETSYTPGARRVRLLSGEAHFIVASNPDRPFIVTAGPVTVRAVGTAFNVRLASAKVEVLVTHGQVKLEHVATTARASGEPAVAPAPAPALVQGQRAVINRAEDETIATVSVDEIGRSEIDSELGWQSTRLVFNNTPLHEVVEGFNRYNQHRLTLGDPKLRDRALTGVFRADNRDGFVRLLRASVDVKAEERTPHETVLLPIR